MLETDFPVLITDSKYTPLKLYDIGQTTLKRHKYLCRDVFDEW